ncbi:TetR/AcrR family transcriptional regulator [Novosphingobium sp. KCTC 2891]|uniref:TetR/AcrR family transcriptional regulator n=1 Tax=Novosphingobium sp. KCTC 2891 TaxID=2989730 RepID=UPI002222D98E|nr:TetR/AcrR family transcriptional regulator [Novosphingobium sp. KCTC 2891]MCW1384140.1 TetR/AcrR family transcriptional regulator [Novosphingobium sp. KCTC 2891]
MSPSSKAPPSATDSSLACEPESADSGHAIPRRGRPSVADAGRLSEKILEASWQVLLSFGFEHFTFDRVARHAHIGKATIYSRFAGKAELMQALLDWRIGRQRASILAHGIDQPPVEAFTARATRVLDMLFSPDGMLMERLIDWVDQEAGRQGCGRGAVYDNALHSIADEFRASNASGQTAIADVELAARFWLEGLLGHARLAASQGNSATADNEAWARRYVRFFFRGLLDGAGPAAS